MFELEFYVYTYFNSQEDAQFRCCTQWVRYNDIYFEIISRKFLYNVEETVKQYYDKNLKARYMFFWNLQLSSKKEEQINSPFIKFWTIHVKYYNFYSSKLWRYLNQIFWNKHIEINIKRWINIAIIYFLATWSEDTIWNSKLKGINFKPNSKFDYVCKISRLTTKKK